MDSNEYQTPSDGFNWLKKPRKSRHLPLSLLQGGKLNFQFRELSARERQVYNVGPVILNLFPPSKGEGKNIDFPPRGGIKGGDSDEYQTPSEEGNLYKPQYYLTKCFKSSLLNNHSFFYR